MQYMTRPNMPLCIDNINPLLITTSKCATSLIRYHFFTSISYTQNTDWLTSKKNLENFRKNKKSFKFSVVRNPYDRAFSCWKHGTTTSFPFDYKPGFLSKKGSHFLPPSLEFEDFLKLNLYTDLDLSLHAITHCIPISEYLNNFIKTINFFIKVENLESDINFVSEKIGYDKKFNNQIIMHNSSYTDEEKNFLLSDQKILNLINVKYKKDFINFNYEIK